MCDANTIAHKVGSYTQGRIAGDLAFADLRFLSAEKQHEWNRRSAKLKMCTENHCCRTCRVAEVLCS